MPIKTQRIVLYHLQSGFDFTGADFSAAGYTAQHSDDHQRLFIKTVTSSPPWLPYLSNLLDDSQDWKNTRHSFVLLCKHGDESYAITGGSGYHCIKDYCTPNFGLELAARMIGDDQISALNQKPLKGDTQQISRVFSAYDPKLDIDNYHRLVKFVAGKGNFEGRTFTISGRSSIVLRTHRALDKLDELLTEVEQTLMQAPKIKLPKSFRQVLDDELIETLDEKLSEAFENFWKGEADRDSLYVEFDDPFNQIRATSYELFPKNRRKPVTINEFDLNLVVESLAALQLPAEEVLNKLRVSVKDEDGNQIEFLRNLRDHMACDLLHEGRVFLKQGKEWIEILDDAKKFADEEVAKLTVETSYMPDWLQNQADEDAYNIETAAAKGWECIHPKKITIEGHSNLEPCDLFDPTSKRLIHVKDTWGSKASYLFLQASTSASFFCDSADFRKKAHEEWPSHFTENFQKDQMTVVIAIAAPSTKISNFPGNLSYFAKLNLLNAAQSIHSKGFRVVLAPITRNR